MFGLGMPELIIILIIVILFFGALWISELGSVVDKGIRNFRKSLDELDKIEMTSAKEKKHDENRKKSLLSTPLPESRGFGC